MSRNWPSRIVVLVKPSPLAGVEDAARQARDDANAAALASGISIRELTHADEHHAVQDLLARVWSADRDQSPLPAHVTRTLSLIGGYVAGAYDSDGELLGAAAGFLTDDTADLGPAHLHSHITGVVPAARSRHVGFALKLHQRAWALSRGITQVTWTFDPLVARNAYFNLVKLGARAAGYLADFYGAMDDGINTGQGSDRLLAQWDLSSPSVVTAIRGPRPHLDLAGLTGAGQLLLRPGPAGAPQRLAGDFRGPVACAIPADIERMRRDDPQVARDWRQAVRAVLGRAMEAGYHITDFARSGCYLLQPGPASRPAGGGGMHDLRQEADR